MRRGKSVSLGDAPHQTCLSSLRPGTQGAAVATLLVATQQVAQGGPGAEAQNGGSVSSGEPCTSDRETPVGDAFGLRFAILASGYPPPGPEAAALLAAAGPLRLPSLHVFGGGAGARVAQGGEDGGEGESAGVQDEAAAQEPGGDRQVRPRTAEPVNWRADFAEMPRMRSAPSGGAGSLCYRIHCSHISLPSLMLPMLADQPKRQRGPCRSVRGCGRGPGHNRVSRRGARAGGSGSARRQGAAETQRRAPHTGHAARRRGRSSLPCGLPVAML
jgi:hypothetical protein